MEPTSPLPPPTEPPAPADPCKGKEQKSPAVNAFAHPYVFNRNWNKCVQREWCQVCFNKLNLSMKLNCAANVQHNQRDAIKSKFVYSSSSRSFSHLLPITIGPSQRLCCSCLVSIAPGWRSKKETQYDRVRVQPGKRNAVSRVLLFRPSPGSCHLWSCAFHLTWVFALLPRKWSLSATVLLSGRKATLLLFSWILSDD